MPTWHQVGALYWGGGDPLIRVGVNFPLGARSGSASKVLGRVCNSGEGGVEGIPLPMGKRGSREGS